jgi:hypothetical protein
MHDRLQSFLKSLTQIRNFDAQRFGDAAKRVHRDRLRATLYGADVNGVQVSFLGELFLTQSAELPINAQIVSEDATTFERGHRAIQHSFADRASTTYRFSLYFFP